MTGITLGFLLAVLTFFMLYPVYDICKLSFFKEGVFTLKNYAAYFTNPRIFRSLTNSLYVSIVTMVITTILAFFFAYGLTRTTIGGKGIFYTISTFPLIAPSIIQGLALILLFGRNGLVTRYLRPNVFTVSQTPFSSFIRPYPLWIPDWMRQPRVWGPLP
jgi:iron(III) transport system permease protein